jgi:TRAP-type C4-dicarboxylate transport system substrate-binding protein
LSSTCAERGRTAWSIATVLAVAFGLAACGGSDPAAPTVLHLRTSVAALELREPGAAFFARRVAQLSANRLRIAVDYVASPDEHTVTTTPVATDPWLVREAKAGHTDLAWVSTNAFDEMGITSLRALDAPMLVDDYGLETAILRSRLARPMVAGIRGAGVEGLGLIEGRLRHPVAVERPLRGPRDYRGLQVGTARSRTRGDAIRALGARVVAGAHLPIFYKTWNDLESRSLVPKYRMDGLETDLEDEFYDVPPSEPGYVTEDVRLWAETAAIVASPARLARLSTLQRSWLRQAAAETQARSFALGAGDGVLLRELCSRGTRFARTSRADRAALKRAFQPVYARLERDRQTRAQIHAIEAMKARLAPGAAPSIPAQCSATHRAIPNLPPSPIPDGVYRTRITRHDLAAWHVPQQYWLTGFGTLTLTLRHDRFKLTLREPNFFDETGPYGGTLARTEFGSDNLFFDHHKLVTVLENGELRFYPVRVRDLVFGAWFGAHPWRKIG